MRKNKYDQNKEFDRAYAGVYSYEDGGLGWGMGLGLVGGGVIGGDWFKEFWVCEGIPFKGVGQIVWPRPKLSKTFGSNGPKPFRV